MDALAYLALAFAGAALVIHAGTSLIAARRCRVPRAPAPRFAHGPSVSIVRPVCGLDPNEEATLAPPSSSTTAATRSCSAARRATMPSCRWCAG